VRGTDIKVGEFYAATQWGRQSRARLKVRVDKIVKYDGGYHLYCTQVGRLDGDWNEIPTDHRTLTLAPRNLAGTWGAHMKWAEEERERIKQNRARMEQHRKEREERAVRFRSLLARLEALSGVKMGPRYPGIPESEPLVLHTDELAALVEALEGKLGAHEALDLLDI
jgi:hypothetical protein